MRDKMHFIDYNDMVSNPEQVMEDIYDFLGEEYYEHTFDGLSNDHRENDLNTYGLGDMHEVHSKLEKLPTLQNLFCQKKLLIYMSKTKNT